MRIPAAPRAEGAEGQGPRRAAQDHHGDLLAKVNVVVPQRLTDPGPLEALQAQERGQDPRADLFAGARKA